MSSTLQKRLYRKVKRAGLPSNFISNRCMACVYFIEMYGRGENIVKCHIVLCPYLGKGYIYRGRTAIQRGLKG